MVNNRPPVDEAGNFLGAAKVGANSTIEVFEHKRGSKKLEYIKTIWSEAVPAPNNVAATGNGSVFVTNDHDEAAGMVSLSSHSLAHETLFPSFLTNLVSAPPNPPRSRHSRKLPPLQQALHNFSLSRPQIPQWYRQASRTTQHTLHSPHSQRLRLLPPHRSFTQLTSQSIHPHSYNHLPSAQTNQNRGANRQSLC
jgi:hypothetical protein